LIRKPTENYCLDYQQSLLVSMPRVVNPTDTIQLEKCDLLFVG